MTIGPQIFDRSHFHVLPVLGLTALVILGLSAALPSAIAFSLGLALALAAGIAVAERRRHGGSDLPVLPFAHEG